MSDPSSIPPIPPIPSEPAAPVIPPIPSVPANPYAAPQSEIIANNPLSGTPATPLNRFAAQFIDGLILLPFNLILTKILLKPDQAAVDAAVARGDVTAAISAASPSFIMSVISTVLVVAVLIAINWKFLPKGQTIGKKVMKTQIQSRDGSLLPVNTLITKRMLPFYLASIVPVIGPILILVDCLCIFRPGRNTLHDDLAQSKVVVL